MRILGEGYIRARESGWMANLLRECFTPKLYSEARRLRGVGEMNHGPIFQCKHFCQCGERCAGVPGHDEPRGHECRLVSPLICPAPELPYFKCLRHWIVHDLPPPQKIVGSWTR